MRRTVLLYRRALGISPFLVALSGALSLAGCDSGKKPFSEAAQAEERGDYAAASTLYEEVCTKKSPLCDAAKIRRARLAVKSAERALDEGRFKDAKGLLGDASIPVDPAAEAAAAALLASPDLAQGVLFEDALAQADKDAAMAAMEGVAREPSAVAPKAKEWLDKNRPALLLAQVKAACAPGGAASCAEASKKIAAAYPGSPEAKEAAGLAAADYKRQYPALKDLENLLIQRAGVYDYEKKLELCKTFSSPGVPGTDEDCMEKYVPDEAPVLSAIKEAWEKKLGSVSDPHFKKGFEERWLKAGNGEYDPQSWPKP